MKTPMDITALDLMVLAREECKRFDVYADSGSYEMFASQRLVRELLLEAIEVASVRGAGNTTQVRVPR